MKNYRERIVDQSIRQKLNIMGAVVIEGSKWCGKTTTAEQFAKSELYLSDPARMQDYRIMGDADPAIMLEGAKPRLIDEWQIAPKLWDAIRNDVDHASDMGRYILTGSSTPQNKEDIFHSGTGRFAWVRMRPMSLYESGDSTGELSLAKLFSGPKSISAKSKLTSFSRLAFLTCRGGWPQFTRVKNEKDMLQLPFEYINGLVRSDLSAEIASRKSLRLENLLRSLARHQGTQASNETILSDVGEDLTSPNTLKADLAELKHLFVTEDVMAWNPNLRSKIAIRTSDTRYFVDPSIATAALDLGPDDLLNDFNTFGLIFETLCIRDLRVYAEQNNGNIYHYRDKTGLECDAVIHLRNGNYGLIEFKLGGNELIEEGASRLNVLQKKLAENGVSEPAFVAIVTGIGEFAYRRPQDGILVVPIGCLKP